MAVWKISATSHHALGEAGVTSHRFQRGQLRKKKRHGSSSVAFSFPHTAGSKDKRGTPPRLPFLALAYPFVAAADAGAGAAALS